MDKRPTDLKRITTKKQAQKFIDAQVKGWGIQRYR